MWSDRPGSFRQKTMPPTGPQEKHLTTAQATSEIDRFMQGLIKRNPGEPEFHQAVQEVVETLMPVVLEHWPYREARILEL